MKGEENVTIAVSSQGPGLKSMLDERFGRCAYFVLVDPDSGEFTAEKNPAVDAAGGAGVQTAQFLVNRDVKAVLVGNIGPKAFAALNAAGVKVFGGISGTVADAVAMYREGKLNEVSESTVPSHYGLGGGQGRGKRGRW